MPGKVAVRFMPGHEGPPAHVEVVVASRESYVIVDKIGIAGDIARAR